MQNLIYLLRKFSFVFLFLFFEVVAVLLIFRRSNFQRVAILNSTSEFTGRVYTAFANTQDYFTLRKENELLAEENARLYLQIEESKRKYYQSHKFKGDTTWLQSIEYIPSKVVNNSIFNQKNYFTIDAGSNYGVKQRMGVISPAGVAGWVIATSPNFAVCMSVLNTDFTVNVQLRKNKFYGPMIWDGKSPQYSVLREIPTTVSIAEGDTLEASGFSLFPEGTMVGTVHNYTINPDDGYYIIKVKLSTQFQALRHVYVVDKLFEEEQRKLEDSVVVK